MSDTKILAQKFIDKINNQEVKLEKIENVTLNSLFNRVFANAKTKKDLDISNCKLVSNLNVGKVTATSKNNISSAFLTQSDPNVLTQAVNFDTTYTLANFGSDTMLFLQLNTNNIKKITSLISFDQSVVFDVGLAQIDSDNNLNILDSHSAQLGNVDMASYLTTGGFYYIIVMVESGVGTCSLKFTSSTQVSAQEPNDIAGQLKTMFTDVVNINDTFDNVDDFDFVHYKLTKDTTLFFQLLFSFYLTDDNFSKNDKFQIGFIQVADKDANPITPKLNAYSLNLSQRNCGVFPDIISAGEYYFFIAPVCDEPTFLNKEYTFTLLPVSKTMPSPHLLMKNVTNDLTDGHGNGYVTLVDPNGNTQPIRWVRGDVDFIADTEDDNGNVLPNIPIICQVTGHKESNSSRDDYLQQAFGISDSDGNLKIGTRLPAVYGELALPAAVYSYPADIDRVYFYAFIYDKASNAFRYKAIPPYPYEILNVSYNPIIK